MSHHEINWEILLRSIKGELTQSEKQELDRWLKASPNHREYYLNMTKVWMQDHKTELSTDLPRLVDQFAAFAQKRQTRINPLQRYAKYAAILIIGLVSIGYLIHYSNPKNESHRLAIYPKIESGSSKAILISSDGSSINIDDSKALLDVDGRSVMKQKGMLNYLAANNAINSKITAPQMNTIVIPVGGEYKVVLADSSVVWLNSDSKLTFPVAFSDHERVVTLQGEGYFEIKKDKTRPFIVSTGSGKVKVYGTTFNISCYPQDHNQTITLATGKIGVTIANEEYTLQPRQQITVSKDNQIQIREVNPEYYVNWHNGFFSFEDDSLKDIMTKLARWYGVTVVFENEQVAEMRFTGDLERYSNFDVVLHMLCQTTNIKAEVDGKRITISDK